MGENDSAQIFIITNNLRPSRRSTLVERVRLFKVASRKYYIIIGLSELLCYTTVIYYNNIDRMTAFNTNTDDKNFFCKPTFWEISNISYFVTLGNMLKKLINNLILND